MTFNVRQLDNPLPSSEEAERCTLGAILMDQRLIGIVAESLKAEDFYNPFHRRVFSGMLGLFQNKKPIDPIGIGEEIRKGGDSLESVGGVLTITNLTLGLPMWSIATAETIQEFCKIVQQKKRMRELVRVCAQVQSSALDEFGDPEDILADAQKAINGICTDTGKKGFSRVADLSVEVVERVIALRNNEIVAGGLKTGLGHLDFITGGFQKSDLVIIAGRPSMGKSALAGQIAMNACQENKGAVIAIFSLEMSEKQYTERLVSSRARVDLTRMRTGAINEREVGQISKATVDLNELNLVIDDSSSINAMEIRSKLLRLQHEHGQLDGVFIDFLQRMASSKKSDNRTNEVSNIARDLKSLAKDFDVPVIALASLSRNCESRNPPIPRMSDLRDSGDIESEADFVSFVYRPHYYDTNADPFLAELIIDKHRHGSTGKVPLKFLGEYTRFTSYEQN